MEDDEGTPTAPLGVWIGLITVACVSFWTQAAVTEERFVPALSVISEAFNIPDDIAGATLMAAGASSPEFFSSIVALFITHSSLGLGTIVGSEIFNQLIICAGAVFASKSGKLQLDRTIVTREVGFYALAIALLLFALRNASPVEDDTVDHIFINFSDACCVFGGYILYVLVCANMDAVVNLFQDKRKSLVAGDRRDYMSIGDPSNRKSVRADFRFLPEMPFLQEKSITNEPASNFEHIVGYARTVSGMVHLERDPNGRRSTATQESGISDAPSWLSKASFIEQSIRRVGYSDGASLRIFQYEISTEKPSDQHELYDISFNSYNETLSCFLWQRSFFYNKAKFATKAWQLRFFTFTRDAVYSIPDRTNSKKHKLTYPSFKKIEVDQARHIIRFMNPIPSKRNYYFMAPSDEILEAVIGKCEEIMNVRETEGDVPKVKNMTEQEEEDAFEDADGNVSLIEFPWGASSIEIVFHIILLPLKALMHYTIPDVRHLNQQGDSTTSLRMACFAALMCLVWLTVGSYAMVASLEDLAELLDIPDSVIGFTVSAAGTSLPNYVASKVAAEKGFGNMAVSNAFGSNTFNIMVGLGLPWLLYTSFGTGFEPYTGLRSEGILESVIILSVVLLVFVSMVLQSGFVLYTWHGYVFIAMYISYLAFAIGQVYL